MKWERIETQRHRGHGEGSHRISLCSLCLCVSKFFDLPIVLRPNLASRAWAFGNLTTSISKTKHSRSHLVFFFAVDFLLAVFLTVGPETSLEIFFVGVLFTAGLEFVPLTFFFDAGIVAALGVFFADFSFGKI